MKMSPNGPFYGHLSPLTPPAANIARLFLIITIIIIVMIIIIIKIIVIIILYSGNYTTCFNYSSDIHSLLHTSHSY